MTGGGERIAKRDYVIEEVDSDEGVTHMSMEKERREEEDAKAEAMTAEAESSNPLQNMVAAENQARIATAREGGEPVQSAHKGKGEEGVEGDTGEGGEPITKPLGDDGEGKGAYKGEVSRDIIYQAT